MEPMKRANQLKIEAVIKNLEKRNITGHYCEGRDAANALILQLIEEGNVVSWGGSYTLDSIGIKPLLAERNLTLIDPYSTKDPAESMKRRHESLSADCFLMSTNAITTAGEMVNIDGTNNRVAALCFGPRKVFVVAGANKIVSTLDAAMERAKDRAAVANAVRLNRNTPCTVTGSCNCLTKDCICANTVITRYSSVPDRIHVILVNEELGF